MYSLFKVFVPLATSVHVFLLIIQFALPVRAQPIEQIPNILEALIERWNKGIDHHNVELLRPCYQERVILDGLEVDLETLLDAKKKFFYQYPGFRQYVGEVKEVHVVNGIYRAFFDKTGLKNGRAEVQKTFLDFEAKEDGALLIVKEGAEAAEVAAHCAWPYIKMGKRKYCFITLGKLLKKGAPPADYEQEYRIRVTEDYRLLGGGTYHSPVSGTTYRLRIRGKLDGKGILDLNIDYLAKDYNAEKNPEGRYHMHQRWKFNGEGIGWIGGDRPQVLFMGIYYCE
ncbi:MAG TPA: hypothetical protein ENJ82_05405 [Bacteroidetes bacterium]|nr:hypothetical protein [Bacteroidota bacterium]